MSLNIVILAAGQGTRMHSTLPKVLQTLAGKPLLHYVIECAKSIGADDISVVYGHGGKEIQAMFNKEPIRWVLQEQQLGTGHAVKQALSDIPDGNNVLILYGDVPLIRTKTINKLLDACSASDLTILTTVLKNPAGYGRVIRKDDRIVSIIEDREANKEQQRVKEINTGVMCCSAKHLKRWLGNLKNNNSKNEYYLTDVVNMAVEEGKTIIGIKSDTWIEVMGINTRKELADAERSLQEKMIGELMAQGVGFADPARVDIRGNLVCGKDVFIDVNTIFEGDVELGNNVTIESNNVIVDTKVGNKTVVHPNCHLRGAVTGENCQIGPFARLRNGAVLSNDVKIGNFVEIKKSNISSGSKINHLTYIGDADIAKNVNIGAGTITCNYDGTNKHQTVIGEGAFIGSGVELVAPVEIGEGATIGAGSTISKSAPSQKLTIERAKQVSLDKWKRPKKKE